MNRILFPWMKYSIVLFIVFLSTEALSKDVTTVVVKPVVREIQFSGKISSPSLSPDNTKIVFVNYLPSQSKPESDQLSSHPEEGFLWLIDLTGDAKPRQFSERMVLSDEPKVTWSSKSDKIAFGSKGDIYVAGVLNGKSSVISNPNGNRNKTYPGYFADYFHSPSWAPNNEVLAIGNVYDIWLYDVGSGQFTLLYSPPKELRPGGEMFWLPSIGWSHNSESLVFLRHRLIVPPQNPEPFSFLRQNPETTFQKTRMVYVEGLAVIEINTKNVTPMIGSSENTEYHPVFSPNNALVAFLSRKDWKSKPSIYVYDISRNTSRQIADCEDECHMLSWSQNSSKLLYATNKYLRIALVNASSSGIERKIRVQGIPDLSDVFWFPRGDTLYFVKPHKAGVYLYGNLDLNVKK